MESRQDSKDEVMIDTNSATKNELQYSVGWVHYNPNSEDSGDGSAC